MFQDRIRKHYDGLTPGFRRLADFIINNTLVAGFLTAGELARRVRVDPATVVRFSQEIGYSGYRDLSREIKQFVQDQITVTYHRSEDAEKEEALIRTLQENLEQNLQHFFTTETPTLTKVIQTLQQASHVWVAGEYISFKLAEIMVQQLQLVGIPSTAFYPSMMASSATLTEMQAGDVLFAIATVYAGIDTGYIVKMAREKGVKTICLTGYGTSLPAREAEIALIAPIQNPTSIVSYEIVLMLISLIGTALSALRPDKVAEAFTQAFDNLSELRKLRAKTLPYEIST